MNIDVLLDLISGGNSLLASLSSAFQSLGILVIVLVLIVGLVFFVPTIIASMRHITLRILVCVLNVLAIALFFTKIYIPFIVWLILMILAIACKPEKKTGNTLPTIQIITDKSEKE